MAANPDGILQSRPINLIHSSTQSSTSINLCFQSNLNTISDPSTHLRIFTERSVPTKKPTELYPQVRRTISFNH